jgi:hypothetical protein
LIKLEFSRQIFEKYLECSRVVPRGQTNGHVEANSHFSQFCEKRLKIVITLLYFVDLPLGIILVNNKLDTCIYLFHFSTCFEQPSAHHQENQLYQYIIWYISLCVGYCLVCRSGWTDIPGSAAPAFCNGSSRLSSQPTEHLL